jgi:CubicO group peptidase (beta-lactamase class C family)
MADTHFYLPAEKAARLAAGYRADKNEWGRFGLIDSPATSAKVVSPKTYFSAAGGLVSTAADYARFAQMLLQGGELDGVRVLSRKSVELMTADHLSGLPDPHPMGNPWQGFGLGVRVTTGLGQSPTLGSVGAFGWDGMATTTVQLDPRERLVAIALYQHLPYDEGGVFATFTNGVYAALER